MKRFVLLILAMVSLYGCVYPYHVEGVDVDRILVIDGSIVIGFPSTFTTRYVTSLAEKTLEEANGKLWVEDSKGNVFVPASDALSSSFEIDMRYASDYNDYRIVFECADNQKTYTSDWVKVASMPTEMKLGYQTKPEEIVIYANLKFSTPVAYFRTNFEQVWEYTADQPLQCVFDPESGSIISFRDPDYSLFYCWNQNSPVESHILSNEGRKEFAIPNATITTINRSDRRLSSLYYVKSYVYGITQEHFEYLRALEKISQVDGNLFSPTPSQPSGNIKCEQDPSEVVIGYIGASRRRTADMYIDGKRFYIPDSIDRWLFSPAEDISLLEYYEYGYVPIRLDRTGEGYLWGPARCVDCTKMGGTKNKPEGWPSNNN